MALHRFPDNSNRLEGVDLDVGQVDCAAEIDYLDVVIATTHQKLGMTSQIAPRSLLGMQAPLAERAWVPTTEPAP